VVSGQWSVVNGGDTLEQRKRLLSEEIHPLDGIGIPHSLGACAVALFTNRSWVLR
jgi:hypothetical protein